MKHIYYNLQTLWGLFLPYRSEGKWGFAMQIGGVPLGWIMIAVALIIKYI